MAIITTKMNKQNFQGICFKRMLLLYLVIRGRCRILERALIYMHAAIFCILKQQHSDQSMSVCCLLLKRAVRAQPKNVLSVPEKDNVHEESRNT